MALCNGCQIPFDEGEIFGGDQSLMKRMMPGCSNTPSHKMYYYTLNPEK
jgi:hypothetical protein